MLASKDISPNKSLYYIAAKIIEIIKKEELKTIDIYFLKDEINKNEYISMPLLLLAFDWLFLLGILKIDDDGVICVYR